MAVSTEALCFLAVVLGLMSLTLAQQGLSPQVSTQVSSGYGDSCGSGPDCTSSMGDGAMCNDSICVCQDEFQYKGSRSYYVIGRLDVECNDELQVCHLDANGDYQHVNCSKGKCTCDGGYVASQDLSECITDAASQLDLSLACVLAIIISYVSQQHRY